MSKVDKNELKIIFQGIRDGDDKSLEMLYTNYYSMIYGIAFSILKNRENSEDIVHNVFTKIMKMDKKLLPSQGEASWLYIVTKNEVVQFLRSQKVTVDIDDLYTLETENSEIEDFIDLTSYHKLIEGLDPVDREIVSLRIISDFTFDKIAQMLGLPLGTVQWKYYKALHYVKASIANLASYIIVISLIQAVKISSKTSDNTSKSEMSESMGVHQNGDTGWTESASGEGYFSSTNDWEGKLNSVTESAGDSTGSVSSVQSASQLFLTIIMVLVTIVFVLFTVAILSMKKVKRPKKK